VYQRAQLFIDGEWTAPGAGTLIDVVSPHSEQVTARFYPRMFNEHPELFRVFNQGNQATGETIPGIAAPLRPTPSN